MLLAVFRRIAERDQPLADESLGDDAEHDSGEKEKGDGSADRARRQIAAVINGRGHVGRL